jgi:hypothetical protein
MNGELSPVMVSVGAGRIIWWVCEKGHEWESVVSSRTKLNGAGCPICSGNKALTGYNDLATLRPDVAEQWHPTKNGELTPDQVPVGSGRKIWWVCDKGHEWKTRIADRTGGSGCPICAGKKVLAGFNDLATLCPDIAAQWHPTKNDALKPSRVTVSSGRKVWWKCERGHEWSATVNNRTRGHGCPVCARNRHSLASFRQL